MELSSMANVKYSEFGMATKENSLISHITKVYIWQGCKLELTAATLICLVYSSYTSFPRLHLDWMCHANLMRLIFIIIICRLLSYINIYQQQQQNSINA